MSLRKFPLDSQMCPLLIGSYGYTADEVKYTWKKPKPLSFGNIGRYWNEFVDIYYQEWARYISWYDFLNPHIILSFTHILDMAQFILERYDAGVTTNKTNRKIASGFRTDSIAYLHFFLERQTGYFLLQYYTPLIVIVMCSWVVSIQITFMPCHIHHLT